VPALRRTIVPGLDRRAAGQPPSRHEHGGAGKVAVERGVGEVVKPCLVELRSDGPPLGQAEIAGCWLRLRPLKISRMPVSADSTPADSGRMLPVPTLLGGVVHSG